MTQSIQNFSWRVVVNNDESLSYLVGLFNAGTNPIACASYGNGDHCVQSRSVAKKNIWGKRAEGDNPDTLCAVARILVSENDQPAILFNIGFTGNPATVIDKRDATNNKSLYELGVFIADAYRSDSATSNIAIEAHRMFHSVCSNDDSHSYALITTTDSTTATLMTKMDAALLTPLNLDSLLGQNSSHPARFNFDDASKECSGNDKNTSVSLNGWFNTNPCTTWVEKSFFLLPTIDKDHYLVEITGDSDSNINEEL